MRVYLLWHTHQHEIGEDDEKLLGVYSSEARALERADQAKELPGFRDAPDGFEVARYELDRDEWMEGYFTES